MALLGKGAVAMWWGLDPAIRPEFEDWHAHEHFPERMGVPGFKRGSRWARTEGDGFFVLYELEQYDVLTSDGYRDRLNNPTPWSTKMMPQHQNMVRSQAHIVTSYGGGVAGFLLTLRIAPRQGQEAALRHTLDQQLGAITPLRGCTGAHLLITETPDAAPTREQLIRGNSDSSASWIVLLNGYDLPSLNALAGERFSDAALAAAGAEGAALRTEHRLAYTLSPADLNPPIVTA